jgi:hypothetical protein
MIDQGNSASSSHREQARSLFSARKVMLMASVVSALAVYGFSSSSDRFDIFGSAAHAQVANAASSAAQSCFTINSPYRLDVQARHAAWVIAWGLSHDATELEASVVAEAAWVRTVVARSGASAERAKACTPGYYNREGQANAKTRQGSYFFGSPTEYADILEASRALGVPEGFEIRGQQFTPGTCHL